MGLKLTDIPQIDEDLAEVLDTDGWTVSLLATTTQKALTRYEGVGRVKAGRIIKKARQLIHEAHFQEAGVPMPEVDEDMGTWLERHWPFLVQRGGVSEPVQRSVRIQRIYDAQRSQ
jgi:hypothetical protein